MRALIEDGDEQLRQRRVEIAAIRLGLEEIARDISKFRRGAPSLILSELRKYGYNPEEPRVPEHSADGGQWTSNGTIVLPTTSGQSVAAPEAAGDTSSSRAPNVRIAAAGGPRCEGFPAGCQNGGSYGTTAMFYIHGSALCMDCAVKILGIQGETASEKLHILNPYYLDK